MYVHIIQQARRAISPKKVMSIVVFVALLPYSAITMADTEIAQHKNISALEQSSMSFAQVLEKVRQYQSKLGVWKVQQSIADAHIQQSHLWENPIFSIQQTGFKSDQDRELEFGISQKLDVFGERIAATQLAQVQRQQVDLNQSLYEAQLELVVKYLWSQVAVFEMENQIAQQQLANSQDILDATRRRYRAGSIAQLDQDRTLMAHIENQRAAQEVELNLNIARKRLANLWGETVYSDRLGFNRANAWPSESKADVAAHLQQNLLQRSISAELRPELCRYRVGLDIPLNIFDRQQYALQIAQTQQDFLAQQQGFYTQQNLNSIETLQSELVGLKQQYDLMNDQQIPLSEDVQRKMLIGFKVGKYAITDVQQATAQLQEQRLKKVQLLKSAWQKAIETESGALGIAPEQVMSSDALNQINQTLWQNTRNFNAISGAE